METTNRKIEEKTSCWYAVYTAAKAEKSVKEQLDKIGIESYLPLQSVVRLWNNRKKKMMIPVLPGCLFVRLIPEDIDRVKGIQGVSLLLREKGQFVTMPECQMETFRCMVDNAGEFVEFVEETTQGVAVQVVRGQLKGVKGELVENEGENRLMLRIAGLGSALVMIAPDSVERV